MSARSRTSRSVSSSRSQRPGRPEPLLPGSRAFHTCRRWSTRGISPGPASSTLTPSSSGCRTSLRSSPRSAGHRKTRAAACSAACWRRRSSNGFASPPSATASSCSARSRAGSPTSCLSLHANARAIRSRAAGSARGWRSSQKDFVACGWPRARGRLLREHTGAGVGCRRSERVLGARAADRERPLLLVLPRRLDRRGEVEALVLALLDQHDGLDRVHVVDPLLLALRRDLRLVRPVVELHLRDARHLAHLAEVELDLVEVLRDVYWFKQIDMPRDSHIHTFFDPGGLTTLAPEARLVKMIPPKPFRF